MEMFWCSCWCCVLVMVVVIRLLIIVMCLRVKNIVSLVLMLVLF